MSSIGTFYTFTHARLGIYAAQNGMNVTGNNISNINTEGYTRQRLDQTSFYAGSADKYYSSSEPTIGNGVLCKGVSQLRDPYLDIRYRGQNANVGAMDAKLSGLEGIQAILDEVGDGEDAFGILGNQFNEIFEALQTLNDQTGHSVYDTQVRATAQILTDRFRSYANQLEEHYNNTVTSLNEDIKQVNLILNNIRDLSAEIRKHEIRNDKALELRDQRNVLIDQLSGYMKIDVNYEVEDIGGGQQIEKLVIRLGNANPDPSVTTDSAELVNGTYSRQLSVLPAAGPENNFDIQLSELRDVNGQIMMDVVKTDPIEITAAEFGTGEMQTVTDAVTGVVTVTSYSEVAGVYYKQVYTKTPTGDVTLDDNDLYGRIQSIRELLTEQGEFTSQNTIDNIDEYADSKRGIRYYQKSLDLLAKQFADVFNEANNGYMRNEKGEYLDSSGNVIMDGGTALTDKMTLTDAQKALLEASGDKRGFNLFSIRGDTDDATGINASNISISSSWTNGGKIVASYIKPTGLDVGTTDSSNIIHMISMFNKEMEFNTETVDPLSGDTVLFSGTFREMWDNMGFVLGSDMQVTSTLLDNYYNSAVTLEESRTAVSSVDLNDEAMSLIQYSKAFDAACRLISTLDSMLDKLINGT